MDYVRVSKSGRELPSNERSRTRSATKALLLEPPRKKRALDSDVQKDVKELTNEIKGLRSDLQELKSAINGFSTKLNSMSFRVIFEIN